MARKGSKHKKGQIKSKKKDGVHRMNQLKFASRAQEKVYEKLAMEFLQDHLPKIMDIVPAEVREERGEEPNPPGKLYKKVIQTIDTKETYVKRAKTFIKWHVINKGVARLGQINRETTDEFFENIARNVGTAQDEYSKKTYDSYVDGTYKMFQALAAAPDDAKTKLDGRIFADSVESSRQMLDRDYKQELRDKIGEYSKEEYKRGSGYESRQASTIMRQAEKYLSTQDQLLVATLVYGTARNDEAQQFTLDCYNRERGSIDMLKNGMTKQNRGRIVLDVHPKVFELAEKLQQETGMAPDAKIFAGYDDNKVRDVVKTCCHYGKIKYSGVHDLRKAYVEKTERELISNIKKGDVTKEDLIQKIMEQVSIKESLNPMIKLKERRYRTNKDGKKESYTVYKKVNGEIVEERKFSVEKLEKMNIEDLLDLHMAEQLGHSDPETTYEYRLEKASERRKAFRKEMRNKRKNEKH
ncbi:hypothetical protein [Peribacillus sp. AS_2]|uniref:hypothetical protein n=1 Tax=Peribacillus sp. AS_2 TaxID=2996755 RepID=UPI0022A6B440|nr:hypothetical protein [Peribacillus sp. AS_2]MCZ0875632.1 hypothetical protein [Peribacillus sp. AS_2]